MRYSTLVEELSATPAYLAIFFVFLLILMHVTLVYWRPLSSRSWKRVDYIWLAAATLGLIGSSREAEHFLSGRYAEHSQGPATWSAYHQLRGALINPAGVCGTYTKGPNSPSDFDAIVREARGLCAKSNEIAKRMPTDFDTDLPPLADTGFERFGMNAQYQMQFIAEINQAADFYEREQRRYAMYRATSMPNKTENLMKVLGPLLLAFALALRITKVTGEVRNSHNKT
jgi:hypothetical protein